MSHGCATCAHAQVTVIDSLLASGKSDSSVSRMYGISRDSVWRHRRNAHVVDASLLASGTPVASGGPGYHSDVTGAPTDPASHLEQQLRDLDAMDIAKMSPNQRMQVMDARRRTVVEIARLQPPPLTAEAKLKLTEIPGFVWWEQTLMSVLEPHPEIRKELALRLRAALKDIRSADGVADGIEWEGT